MVVHIVKYILAAREKRSLNCGTENFQGPERLFVRKKVYKSKPSYNASSCLDLNGEVTSESGFAYARKRLPDWVEGVP